MTDNRSACRAGELAYHMGEPRDVPVGFQYTTRQWFEGWDMAREQAQRQIRFDEGEMPEAAQTWLRRNLKLYVERSSGLARVHLSLGDEIISSVDIDLQEPLA